MPKFTPGQAYELSRVLEPFCDCYLAIQHIKDGLTELEYNNSSLEARRVAKESLILTLNTTRKYLLSPDDHPSTGYCEIADNFDKQELVAVAGIRLAKFEIKLESLRLKLKRGYDVEIAS